MEWTQIVSLTISALGFFSGVGASFLTLKIQNGILENNVDQTEKDRKIYSHIDEVEKEMYDTIKCQTSETLGVVSSRTCRFERNSPAKHYINY